MSRILEVEKITKKYPAFLLDNASFSLESGSIMGFIGRNGAGKTTIIKSILNLIHTDSGEPTETGGSTIDRRGGEEKEHEEAGERWDLESLGNPWDKELEHEGMPQPVLIPVILRPHDHCEGLRPR